MDDTTNHTPNVWRSIGAVFAGIVFVILTHLVMDVLMHATGVFPPWGQPMSDALFLWALIYRTGFSIAGAYVTARLAPQLVAQGIELQLDIPRQATLWADRELLRRAVLNLVLNAIDAMHDGGELVIQHGFGAERIKLAAGDAVLYPGTSVHEVTPVTRGERLAAFFWIESLVRSDEDRALLYQMDQALRELRGRHGESAATVRLTGTYHNLLRRWADT